MELHQLRYFVAVVETGSFTAAARKCFVAQPSLSQQIKKLEDELGQPLINRLGRHAELTPAGSLFLERARRILWEVEDAARIVHDEGEAGRLRVGVLPSIAPYLLAEVLTQARVRLPGTVAEIDEDFRSGIIDGVVTGRLDLAIATLPPEHANLETEVLLTEPLLVAMPVNHPFLSKSDLLSADLAGQRLVFLGEASSLGLQTRRFFGDLRIQVEPASRCSQVKTVKTLVAAGLGLAIIPKMAADLEHPGVRYRALSDAKPQREIVIVRHHLRFHSRAERAFVEVLRECCAARRSKDAGT
jgi:LysR family transcriptional regulator, hydrogen peroxide-inducible genes activator